jgi:hypothetical protein
MSLRERVVDGQLDQVSPERRAYWAAVAAETPDAPFTDEELAAAAAARRHAPGRSDHQTITIERASLVPASNEDDAATRALKESKETP